MAVESFKIYSLQQDGTRIPAMVSAGQTSVEEETSSSVKEMTAAELTAMDIVARKAMYEDGIRLLQVYNNNTIVLLSLDANGKTSQVSEYRSKNLLDNSDFTNPVNQRGQTSYTTSGYTIDRWRTWENGTITLTSEGLKGDGTHACILYQTIELHKVKPNKAYTVAAGYSDGTIVCQAGIYTTSGFGKWNDEVQIVYLGSDNDTEIPILLLWHATKTIQWVALYEGSYTVDTLPAYVPKGYTTELSECKRYFQKVTSQGKFFGDTASYAGYVYVPYEQEMRVVPTLGVTANGSLIGEQAQGLTISSTPVAVNSSTTGMTVQVPSSDESYILCVWSEPSFILDANL